jgi:hypothetical protein
LRETLGDFEARLSGLSLPIAKRTSEIAAPIDYAVVWVYQRNITCFLVGGGT